MTTIQVDKPAREHFISDLSLPFCVVDLSYLAPPDGASPRNPPPERVPPVSRVGHPVREYFYLLNL